MKPRLLDLFCGAGGMAAGYADAGFEVAGVDIAPQPNYPFEFQQADATAMSQDIFRGCWHESYRLSLLPGMLNRCLGRFDAIHASPPCQAFTDLRSRYPKGHAAPIHPDYVAAVRAILVKSGLPYVIENVEGAPLIDPVTLCGTMFPGLRVIRHRLFETNFPITAPEHPKHPLVFTHDKRKAHHGQLDQDTSFVQVTGGGNCTVANKRAAMGVPWMTGAEANEAIPPAYATSVGGFLLAEVERRNAVAA